jgi:hypothetical protein
MLIGKLNCGVNSFIQRGPHAKKTLTQIFVRMGDEVIAERTIPGKWNAFQALTEFRRFPDRFTPRPNFTAATLKQIAA